ncbi:alpha/beta-hydrolase [Trichoderma citrinoviride]|uniref:Alpha/beta-hydrolase n=1 Tax=Trichoderma citrinoviride TaxID=58853 RepID=A0A2T4BCI2_9HYPO|nr:alpha/beta-hydrolase [Trichoderma citrinoviride]PTB66951.1 alpha/beta-hydrolase [Trichoderma citrinoviride]
MHTPKAQAPPEANVFYVGGSYIQDARGTHMTGSMYVRRHGNKVPGQPPIVFIHGASQTGTTWEATPDNRPGLALLQAADNNWECYVVDQPGVGRSRYHEADMGPLTHYTVEELEAVFTAPRPEVSSPWASLHTQWPGSGKRGDPVFDAFYASQVGHIGSYAKVETLFRPAIKALLNKIGPAFLVTHSQSGPLGWHAADACPGLVCGIVALEPHGPPFVYPDCPPFNTRPEIVGKLVHPFGITSTPLEYDPPLPEGAEKLPCQTPQSQGPASIEETGRYAGLIKGPRQGAPARQLKNLCHVPVLLVTAEGSYHSGYDHLTAQFLSDAGVPVEHVYLADEGIRGNGHMMAIERNNKEIQEFINRWLMKQVPNTVIGDIS